MNGHHYTPKHELKQALERQIAAWRVEWLKVIDAMLPAVAKESK